jgi:glycosyltransferase involved in cell wall biosynthesis
LKYKINIIIPCYNPPSSGWAANIVSEYQALQLLVPSYQLGLVVVNDGSTKGVKASDFDFVKKEIADSILISYEKNRGKGHALRQGIAASEADFYVFTDVDFPYQLFSVAKIMTSVVESKGIAAGYRNQTYYKKVPLFRKLLSIAFRSFIRFVGIPVSDTQCGLKGFDHEGKAIFLKTTTERYLFDFEFLILASRQKNIPIYSVPVQLKEGVQFTTMGWKVLQTEFFNLIKILMR